MLPADVRGGTVVGEPLASGGNSVVTRLIYHPHYLSPASSNLYIEKAPQHSSEYKSRISTVSTEDGQSDSGLLLK